MDIVFWVLICVGGTAVPILFDLLQTFLPRKYRLGRLLSCWQKPVLLGMVGLLCASGYYLFWSSVLPYSHSRLSVAGTVHGVFATFLWVNTVWNYAICVAVDPGVLHPTESAIESGSSPDKTRYPSSSRYCSICQLRVLHFDHHCPFTGGCIGSNNFRFFVLFCVHCSLGMGYACYLSFFPFRDCVLHQCTIPALGLYRVPPPDVEACEKMAARSLLLIPCAVLFCALSCLTFLHLLLLVNGLTTSQYARRFNAKGLRSFWDLLFGRGEAETDKWLQVFGRPSASSFVRFRMVMFPSLPQNCNLSPGIGSLHHWATAAIILFGLTCMAHVGSSLLTVT